MPSTPEPELERAAALRRLRAALGASGDALLSAPAADAPWLLQRDLTLLQAICTPDELRTVWRDLRNLVLAHAANLPATDRSIALLRRHLAEDEGRLPP